MPLSDALTRGLRRDDASSFRLQGDCLWLVTGKDLCAAANEHREQLEKLPPELRDRLELEQEAFGLVAHRWLARYNQSLEDRLRGYVAIGEALGFEYPWPVVAVLGVLQVKTGVLRSEALRLAGAALPPLLELGDWMQDVFRRTNRTIFADSVPTVLLALRVCALRRKGDLELAAAMIDGPLLPAMDEESRGLARKLSAALELDLPGPRFAALAALTALHFEREQAIFTAGMGATRSGEPPRWSKLKERFTRLPSVNAPTVTKGRFRFAKFELPGDFDVRDHRQRAEQFGRAFVASLTGSAAEYRIAASEVLRRFEGGSVPRFEPGGARLIDWQRISSL